jgi:hypothetical protein
MYLNLPSQLQTAAPLETAYLQDNIARSTARGGSSKLQLKEYGNVLFEAASCCSWPDNRYSRL